MLSWVSLFQVRNIFLKNAKFSIFILLRQKNLYELGQKYLVQSLVSLSFTAGQKYVVLCSGQVMVHLYNNI